MYIIVMFIRYAIWWQNIEYLDVKYKGFCEKKSNIFVRALLINSLKKHVGQSLTFDRIIALRHL
jgi:hypothetical protein